MSLLMKALEKAAKDRVDTAGEPAAPATPAAPGASSAASSSELTLEPAIATPRAPAPPPSSAKSAAAAGAPAARESAQAAALIRAAGHREPTGNIFSYLRDRPLMVFGVLATLFIIGFGGYVYVEMNPGLFAKQGPRPTPVAQAPAPATSSNPAPAAPQPAPLTSLLLPPAQTGGTEKSTVPPAAAAPAAVAAASVAAAPVPAPAPAPIVSSAPRDNIKIVAGSTAPTINPVLSEAYTALTTGNLESSQRLYNQLLKSDPRNTEALLGLAAIATQQGDRDAANKHYVKVLEFDPRNAFAQAGLIGMLGRADPQSAETRVKQLISRDPSEAYLHFTLGNTYVDQNRWPDAQQAFFQAHHLQPDNPDYAYNLAVALEHIGQSKSALDFYRRAVTLAAAKGHANFSTAAARDRVAKLEKTAQ